MSVTVQLFDRRKKRLICTMPFEGVDALSNAIGTAKAQRELAVVSNGKVTAAYLDGQLIDGQEPVQEPRPTIEYLHQEAPKNTANNPVMNGA
jgi:hypothetical protein